MTLKTAESWHWLAAALATALMVLAAGCTSGKPQRNFPPWASAQCYGALNHAKSIVTSTGRKVNATSVTAEFVPGARRFGAHWAWHEHNEWFPSGEGWVLGTCDGRHVRIAIDPARATDPGAINHEVLVHEFVHHWLIGSGYGAAHFPEYDDLVWNWRHARSIGKSREMKSAVPRINRRELHVNGINYNLVEVL